MAHRAFKPVSTTTEQGFSLVEVLMAAIVMMGLLIGTNRLVMQGMASSGELDSGAGLEQEILNDIESIQAIDTLLNGEPALSAACPKLQRQPLPQPTGGSQCHPRHGELEPSAEQQQPQPACGDLQL